MARWSSGQDGGLSRRKREFDSPTGHQKRNAPGMCFAFRGRFSIVIEYFFRFEISVFKIKKRILIYKKILLWIVIDDAKGEKTVYNKKSAKANT